jgi:hypothetical protein
MKGKSRVRQSIYPSQTMNPFKWLSYLWRNSRGIYSKSSSNPILSRPVPINLFTGRVWAHKFFEHEKQWTLNTEKRVSELGLQWRTPDICCMSEFHFDTSFLNKLLERNSSRKHYTCDFLYTTVPFFSFTIAYTRYLLHIKIRFRHQFSEHHQKLLESVIAVANIMHVISYTTLLLFSYCEFYRLSC